MYVNMYILIYKHHLVRRSQNESEVTIFNPILPLKRVSMNVLFRLYHGREKSYESDVK